ncbi:rhamnulokinase [Enterococcus sp. CWB-B31]|uniref:rhamnulokinase n=1 Tax=Enterococcus sp. CWB-B31 TaxID=2885159 RepID=UPI001E5A529B|nr:rhamnulokinase [Enterococcus sp. CWB-B31]MCB5954333.1 rhamnulokinase [Enterococcus sp. CWB-B31]
MIDTYIAVDIGASSGRLMKSKCKADGSITLEEIHRFKNGFRKVDGHDRWDIKRLIKEILIGLEKLKKSGVASCYVGIDTWAVDYCLVDETGRLLEEPISYRDVRTENAIKFFSEAYSLEKLYDKTGIQIQPFNTLFQLFVEDKEKLSQAAKLLLIPDYLGFVFTGKAVTEKTNASTMQLLNLATQDWDQELLALAGITKEQLSLLADPGTFLGELIKDQFLEYDLPNASFITVATHDTASAVIGTPGCGKEWAYLSSGTWSLLGIETKVATITRNAFYENYTNEWGAHNTIRFLKNIMGMWLIQEVARIQNYQYSYAELAVMAAKEEPFQQFINVNDERFLNPENMILTIQDYCRETSQRVPKTTGQIARCIYDSLALCYAVELEKMKVLTDTGRPIDKLQIVGGGSKNKFLNQLTANAASITVEAGPDEATAIGNILLQMIAAGTFKDLEEAREAIRQSFEISVHEPEAFDAAILDSYKNFLKGAKS